MLVGGKMQERDQEPPGAFFIGWDVGGWHCDNNRKSRDAIVILDTKRSIVGTPWRGNLRTWINGARTSEAWLHALFSLCGASLPHAQGRCILAIDAPLGFPDAFVNLVARRQPVETIGDARNNPYLLRETERHLIARGHQPLSPIKDMIGSQATKGMHVLARLAPQNERCGVWTDGKRLRVIEAYPSACRHSPQIATLRRKYPSLGHQDKEDALICALIAWLFANDPDCLETPPDHVTPNEGWIWVEGF